jgi:hypothetical protein
VSQDDDDSMSAGFARREREFKGWPLPDWSKKAATGWQPIETAPKNQMIDLLFRGDQRIVDCIFYCGEWWSCEQGDPVVCVSYGPSQPLYWMPIPEPPK